MKRIIVGLVFSLGFIHLSAAFEGNAADGQTKSAMCAACHGVDGNSVVPMYPKLAGQHANYIAKQLADFKTGAQSGGAEGRQDPIMAGMVMALSEQDMADLAAFYQSQTISANNNESSEIGKKLYFGGDAKRGVTACVACHGVDGSGMQGAGFPALKAQNYDYIKAQLEKFKSGARANDTNGMMRGVVRKLKDDDIEHLSKYISSLN